MAFRVEIAPQAFEDLDAIARHIQQSGSFESAERWFNGMIEAIRKLGTLPGRCPIAEESRELQSEVRLPEQIYLPDSVFPETSAQRANTN